MRIVFAHVFCNFISVLIGAEWSPGLRLTSVPIMPTFKVNVKWGKTKFSDVECCTDEPPIVFKAQLFALSGVQPDRLKVMMKGGVLKDESWDNMKIKEGVTLLMMGTAEDLPQVPTDKPVFVEDMSEQQLASALDMPPGLTNLGNTCYMNATVQCLRTVPELQEALKRYSGGLTVGGAIAPADSITAAMRDLYNSMERTASAFPPLIFLQVLHMAYPRFAEKGENGVYVQQDANECWTEMVRCLQQKLPAVGAPDQPPSASFNKGFMDQYFAGEFQSVMTCSESEEEAETKSSEVFYQLSCFIEKDVKYMNTGLKYRLEESVTKNSPYLGRDAIYKKVSKICRLPGYLTIQFVRFFFKGKEAINAKVLRDVKFQMSLDVFDLCTEELQQKLIPMREKFKKQEDKMMEEAQKNKDDGTKVVQSDKDVNNLMTAPYSFNEDIGSSNSGYYELTAVLTHKGRSSSSGHYVSWVRRKGDDWLMFDDDRVSPVTSEDILRLSGGGDWHCAYVLLYSPRLLKLEDNIAA